MIWFNGYRNFQMFTLKSYTLLCYHGNSKHVLFTKTVKVFDENQLHDFVENHNLWRFVCTLWILSLRIFTYNVCLWIVHLRNYKLKRKCCVMVLYVLFFVVLCVSFCTGHFVMVPLNLTYRHCLQHFFFEHLFNLFYLKQLTTWSMASLHSCTLKQTLKYQMLSYAINLSAHLHRFVCFVATP